MNPLTDILFTIAWFVLLVIAIRQMSKGWGMINENPRSRRDSGVWTTEVTKPIHPEMKDVEPGEQLMGVTFEKKTSCDLEEYQDLQNRINQLKSELEDPWDDEDDDGDVPAVVRR